MILFTGAVIAICWLTGEEAEYEIVGAGGVDYFRFKALKAGETEITMVYKRSWEEPTSQDETKVFTVNID